MNRKLLPVTKKRSRKKEDIIREGDIVKIVEPYEFERCGYPLTLRNAKKIVESETDYVELKNKIIALLTKDPNKKAHESFFDGSVEYSNGTLDSRLKWQIEAGVESILAKMYLYRNNYGGPERSLHCRYKEELKHIYAKVVGIKFHKTGIYTSGWNYVGYDGEADYQPAYLTDEKTHKILTLELLQDIQQPKKPKAPAIEPMPQIKYSFFRDYASVWMGDKIRIEDINVKKLTQEEIDSFFEERNKQE